MNTYSIAHLAAIAYLNSKGLKAEGACKYVCFLVEHPEVNALRFDVIEALIGTGATVSVNALEGAYYWER